MTGLRGISRTARALGDPTRVRILAALSVRSLCVCELTSVLGVGQPVVSRHLGILRAAGLVEDARDGRFVEYRLARAAGDAFAAAAIRAVAATAAADPSARRLARRASAADRRRIAAADPSAVRSRVVGRPRPGPARIPVPTPPVAAGGAPCESGSRSSVPAAGSAGTRPRPRSAGSPPAASRARS